MMVSIFFKILWGFTMLIKIKTNNIPRDVINAWELTPAERSEFEYLNWVAIDDGSDSALFFRYRGELYDLNEFVRIIPRSNQMGPIGWMEPVEDDSPLSAWDGIRTDSFFSAIVIRWYRDEFGRSEPERVVVGFVLS